MSDGQKSALSANMEFVQKMIKKVENTEFEDVWKKMRDLINTTEGLSMDKTLLIESTLTSLKNKLKSYEELSQETVKKSTDPSDTNFKKPANKKKTKKTKTQQQNTKLTPIKLLLTKKYATMASPRREKIPLLKINMREIQRMKSLKKERKLKKRLKLFIVRRGQSLKREIMSPPHNDQECDNQVVNDSPDFENNSIQPPEDLISCSKTAENLNLNSDNLLQKFGIQNCSVMMDKIPEKNSPKILPNTEANQPQKEPSISPVLVKKLNAGKSQTPKVLKNKSTEKIRNPQKDQIPFAVKNNQDDSENQLKCQTPPMVSIPTELVFSLLQNSNEILLSADSTMRKLRPWLKSSDHQKKLNYCNEMIKNEYCLAALYKCMASSCGYYTNTSFLFHQHMRLHWENQREDAKNFCQCPYCDNFKNENSYLALINHITDDHGYCRYQCTYCFYRSFDYHIVTHSKVFHSLESKSTIKCEPIRNLFLNPKKELSEVWQNIFSNCRRISCVVCKEKFLSIKHFHHHFESHQSIPPSQCIKCKLVINNETELMIHLKGCHKFGNYNCAFCKFGTDSIEMLKVHLANEHANKTLLFFDRNHSFDEHSKNEISKQLAVKKLTLHLSKRWNEKSFPRYLLENAANVSKNLEMNSLIKTETNEQL